MSDGVRDRFVRPGANVDLAGAGWDVPEAVRNQVDFHWFHVKPKSCLVLVVLSPVPSWYVGHFDGGRMRKCTKEMCPYCDRQIGRQLRYLVHAVEMVTRIEGVLELGKENALLLKDHAARAGSLRGLVIELSKASSAKQSRTELAVLSTVAPPWALSKSPLDLSKVLEETWDRQMAGK